jgi:electron transport complex, rnfabcdGe type, g subunit
MKGVDMAAENGTLVVAKDGGKVDAITASTITSRAFLDAVNRAYKYYLEAAGSASAGAEATDASVAAPQDEASTAAETPSTEDNAAPAEKGDNK